MATSDEFTSDEAADDVSAFSSVGGLSPPLASYAPPAYTPAYAPPPSASFGYGSGDPTGAAAGEFARDEDEDDHSPFAGSSSGSGGRDTSTDDRVGSPRSFAARMVRHDGRRPRMLTRTHAQTSTQSLTHSPGRSRNHGRGAFAALPTSRRRRCSSASDSRSASLVRVPRSQRTRRSRRCPRPPPCAPSTRVALRTKCRGAKLRSFSASGEQARRSRPTALLAT